MRKPMRYMSSTITTGAAWFSLTTTRSPFGSLRYSTGTVKFELGVLAAAAPPWRPCAAGIDAAPAAKQTTSNALRISGEFTIRVLDVKQAVLEREALAERRMGASRSAAAFAPLALRRATP